jgi:hypothetical protein
MPKNLKSEGEILKEAAPDYCPAGRKAGATDIDISLLQHSLSLTPWERMLANDDALNFADSLRAGMERRNAKP